MFEQNLMTTGPKIFKTFVPFLQQFNLISQEVYVFSVFLN